MYLHIYKGKAGPIVAEQCPHLVREIEGQILLFFPSVKIRLDRAMTGKHLPYKFPHVHPCSTSRLYTSCMAFTVGVSARFIILVTIPVAGCFLVP